VTLISGRTGARGALAGLGLLSLAGYAVDLHALFGRDLGVLAVHVALFAGLFALYVLALGIVWRQDGRDRILLGLVLGFGLAFRLVTLPSPVVLSSDVFRYLWDGRVQRAGISPYRFAPAAPELASLRDATVFPSLNRPTKRTVYPPGAEALFALVATVAPGVTGWRLVLLACEAATVLLLLRLLRRLGRPPTAVIVYAWAPLVVFEGLQSGHLDLAVLPPLLLALLWRQDGHGIRAGVTLGVAVLIKLYPAVLLLAWWRRGQWRFPLAGLAVVAAGYAAYAPPVGLGVLGFLPEYVGRAEDFNVGLRFFLTEGLGLGGERARGLAMLALGAGLVAVLLRIRHTLQEDGPGIFRAGLAAIGAYLLLMPTTLHPWYVLWMVPLLAVSLSAGWLWFTGAVAISYLHYAWYPEPFPLWARALEFAPLYALLVWEWIAPRTRAVDHGTRWPEVVHR
jgi:hypothetical protein